MGAGCSGGMKHMVSEAVALCRVDIPTKKDYSKHDDDIFHTGPRYVAKRSKARLIKGSGHNDKKDSRLTNNAVTNNEKGPMYLPSITAHRSSTHNVLTNGGNESSPRLHPLNHGGMVTSPADDALPLALTYRDSEGSRSSFVVVGGKGTSSTNYLTHREGECDTLSSGLSDSGQQSIE